MLHEADAMVCLKVPADFQAVGRFFDDFGQLSDQDVIAALRDAGAKISALA
jgi:putative phosphoribosyl transferase